TVKLWCALTASTASENTARLFYVSYAGGTTAAKLPIIPVTIIKSIRAKPLWKLRSLKLDLVQLNEPG
ncbi:MAG: hypothetical protein CMQ14_06315, partial [Gammaproteobacteria bacterium]|nr:hypothetical protein [Gammaproteobacteria bacterium]